MLLTKLSRQYRLLSCAELVIGNTQRRLWEDRERVFALSRKPRGSTTATNNLGPRGLELQTRTDATKAGVVVTFRNSGNRLQL